jgi:hypothetical protein
MINFKCKTCGNEMKAEDSRKGMKENVPFAVQLLLFLHILKEA